MSWEVTRSIGLIMFLCGSIVLFAVLLGQYFDPSKQDVRVRSLSDWWMRSAGDGLMIIGACVALIGFVNGYLASLSTGPQLTPTALPE
jgi:heme/copper-type cytochrome/quinol oxidase subunit 3